MKTAINYLSILLLCLFSANAISGNDFIKKSDVLAHISGNTEKWTKGGAFYSEDGKLDVVWKGKKSSGTWEVSSEGKLCVVVKMWGDSKECHQYVNDKGTIKLYYDGKARVAEIKAGNQLSSL